MTRARTAFIVWYTGDAGVGDTVGLLVSRRLLEDTLAGRPTFEEVRFYARAARRYGVELFMFEPGGIDRRKRRAVGYVPALFGRYVRAERPIPRAVYDRTAPGRIGPAAWLERQGARVFNPPVRLDKFTAYELLKVNPAARVYLPETYLLSDVAFDWFASVLEGAPGRPGEVFIKPVGGSLGRRVGRFVQLATGGCRFESGGRKVTFRSARAAWRWLLRKKGKRAGRYIVQEGIPLAEDRGRRFDLRVPVQRGRDGCWRVIPPRARRAGRLGYVTNVARGGSVVKDVRALLARCLPSCDPDVLSDKIEEAALAVAAALARKYPRMADVGLDMGVDREGRPWLIEVNVRPLRYTVEGVGDWSEAYDAPIGYAAYLLRGPERPAPEWRSLASIFYRRD